LAYYIHPIKPIIIIMDALLTEFNEDKLKALTGVTHDIFRSVYNKYCGVTTPINRPLYLLVLLTYYKTYPSCNRGWCDPLTRVSSQPSRALFRIRKWELYLASVIDELDDAWNDRVLPSNHLPHGFSPNVVGCVDTFPIYCRRPADFTFQKHLYNGKYGGHVLKVQAVCDHSGCIIWYSGPHIGTTHDVQLFRQFPPPLTNGESLLGDLAYIGGGDGVIVPFKKRSVQITDQRGQIINRRRRRRTRRTIPLNSAQRLYNRVQQWYRASIEHAFGYLKRYHIINSTYRGRLVLHSDFIHRAVRIIIHISTMYMRTHPHRQHVPFTDDDIDFSRIDFDAVEVREWDDETGTGHTLEDFWTGQLVELYSNGEWWTGRISYVNERRGTVTVYLAPGGVSVPNVLPAFVRYRRSAS
jgi:hypothetical protein